MNRLTKFCNQQVDMVANSTMLIERLRTLQLLRDAISTWMFTLNTLHDVQEFNNKRKEILAALFGGCALLDNGTFSSTHKKIGIMKKPDIILFVEDAWQTWIP